MNILAFDTATSSWSVAFWRDGQILAQAQEVRERGHAERLLPMIEQVLTEANSDYSDLDLLAVTVGPGAFTGIRIGLAAARSLALAANLPLLGVSSFEAIVCAINDQERRGHNILVALETKRADIYGQFFAADKSPLGDPVAVLPEMLPDLMLDAPMLIAGDASDRVMAALESKGDNLKQSKANPFADPAVIASLAADKWREGKNTGIKFDLPEPIYLRPPDVNPPKPV